MCEPSLSPEAFTALLAFSSPRRVVKPCVPAALGSDADLCHQGSGLGKDALRPAERFERHSLKWNVCAVSKGLDWRAPSKGRACLGFLSSCRFSGCHCVQMDLDQITLLQSSIWNRTSFLLIDSFGALICVVSNAQSERGVVLAFLGQECTQSLNWFLKMNAAPVWEVGSSSSLTKFEFFRLRCHLCEPVCASQK